MYCSRECQTADWPAHRKECKKLRKEALLEKQMVLAQSCRSVPVVTGKFIQIFRTIELDTRDIFLQSRIIGNVPESLKACYCETSRLATPHTVFVGFPVPVLDALKPISPFSTAPPTDKQVRISPRFSIPVLGKRLVYEVVASISEGIMSTTLRNVSSDDELARSEGTELRLTTLVFSKKSPADPAALAVAKHKTAGDRVTDSFVECSVGESRCISLIDYPAPANTLPTRADIAAATGVSKDLKGKEAEQAVCLVLILEPTAVIDTKAKFEASVARRMIPRSCDHPLVVASRIAAGMQSLRENAAGVEVVWAK